MTLDPSIKFLDPARWQAAKEGVFLLKRYHTYAGCIDTKTFDFSTSMIEELEQSLTEDISEGDHVYYYQCFKPDGTPWPFTDEVRVKVKMGD